MAPERIAVSPLRRDDPLVAPVPNHKFPRFWLTKPPRGVEGWEDPIDAGLRAHELAAFPRSAGPFPVSPRRLVQAL